jgi:hypothetical protein
MSPFSSFASSPLRSAVMVRPGTISATVRSALVSAAAIDRLAPAHAVFA